ncbi:MAG: SAM-dependent chlorinase/fluorinase [Gammaproteobacteria bacterium]|nr:SAM-dependent chlorinase/fluorinase [Gammaproteobacteria bacterium]
MIVTFSDFGVTGPYLGQVRVVLARQAPGVPVVDLLADAPAFNPRASAYLLAALVADLPAATVVLGVVDPGVGTERPAVIVRADDRWLVGPGNGLFDVVAKRARARERWSIRWRPERLSRTFQGRDLFAPVAARIAHGEWPEADPFGWGEGELDRLPDDLPEVVYVDPYGNAMTGLRASVLPPGARIEVGGVVLEPKGEAFWYENSLGLAEIAVNCGSATRTLGIEVGTLAAVLDSGWRVRFCGTV